MERDYAVTLRLKGQGLLRVMIYNYPRLGTGNEIDQDARRRGGGLPTRLLGEVRVDSGAWQTHRFAFRKADPLHISALALAIQEGDVMIDEAFMLPAPDPKAQ